MTTGNPHSSRQLEHAVKWAVLALLGYWGLYALVVPATVWDAQTYNLARLLIAHDGGLFGNPGWNTERQVSFPWSFDAVHYSFLFLGFGYALPSFACFAGILIIVFRVVREYRNASTAWWCCLSLLSLPTLMFQATSVKNDLAVVFGVACWYYALRLWNSQKKGIFLWLMGLSLGFSAGAKTSGLIPMALLAAYTLWYIGKNKRALAQFCASLAAALLLMGSVETYVNNVLVYKYALGERTLIHDHENRDGLRGATANAVRYFFGVMNVGVDVARHSQAFAASMSDSCRSFLRFTGLENAGYRSDFNDGNMRFMKDGVEAADDYGPVGAAAILFALCTLLIRPVRSASWKLAALGFLSFGTICYSIAWMPWNNRFLLLPMMLFTLLLTLQVTGRCESPFYRAAAKPFFIFLLFPAIAFPCYSYNKGPRDLLLSITHREKMATKENPDMLEIIQDIEALPKKAGPAVVLLYAGKDSWVLPILQLPFKVDGLDVRPTPELSDGALKAAKEKAAGRPVYILTLARPLDPDAGRGMTLIRKYAARDCSLVELH